jgi:hypothetical protein
VTLPPSFSGAGDAAAHQILSEEVMKCVHHVQGGAGPGACARDTRERRALRPWFSDFLTCPLLPFIAVAGTTPTSAAS